MSGGASIPESDDIEAMVPGEREAKLPGWARNRLRELRREVIHERAEVRELRRQLNLLAGTGYPFSDTTMDVGDTNMGLPKGVAVTFQAGCDADPTQAIEVAVDPQGRVVATAAVGSILVAPLHEGAVALRAGPATRHLGAKS